VTVSGDAVAAAETPGRLTLQINPKNGEPTRLGTTNLVNVLGQAVFGDVYVAVSKIHEDIMMELGQ
jgi:hypothetical protein